MSCRAQLLRRDHVGALHDGFVEQAACTGRRHEIHDAQGPGGFAGDGDIGRIAAKGRDIALHPLQRLDLVEQAVVSRDVPP